MAKIGFLFGFLSVFLGIWAFALEPTAEEMAQRDAWLAEHFQTEKATAATLPFSFVYEGKSSRAFLDSWKQELLDGGTQDGRTHRTLVFTEPNGRLEVRCEMTLYDGFPHVEWTLKFRNLSDNETPILENIQGLDVVFPTEWSLQWMQPQLHHSVGSPCRPDDYEPKTMELPCFFQTSFVPGNGYSSNEHWPYFSLQTGIQSGWILVVGWPGEWRTTFQSQCARVPAYSHVHTGTHVTAGQDLTHFKLLAHEEVSSPVFVLQPWRRTTWMVAQNVWRSWLIQYNLPRVHGQVDRGHLWGSTDRVGEIPFVAGQKERNEVIDRYVAERIPVDFVHIDAGWYPCKDNWVITGTWEVDKTRYPDGLQGVFGYAKKFGIRSVLWMEPERIHPEGWLAQNHPEWCHGILFKYHVPEAWQWMLERIDQILTESGADLYRQDFNLEPLPYWRPQDTPDRQGITEIRHIEAYLQLWEELARRHPDMEFDACASGGRRNDLLSMRHAIPLCRSDYSVDPISRQGQSYGMHLWIPFSGSGYGVQKAASRTQFDYNYRSWAFTAYSGIALDMNQPTEFYDDVRRNLALWKKDLLPYFGADYYPLTPYSRNPADWLAWQYYDAQKASGVIQVFRQDASAPTEQTLRLFGLEPEATYVVTNADTGETVASATGRELTENGLRLTVSEAPIALVLPFQKK